MFIAEEIKNKWKAVLEHSDLPKITDPHRAFVTACMLETTEQALSGAEGAASGSQRLFEQPIPANFMGASSSTHGTGGIDTFDPVLISLVRRSMPNLMAYDVMGVQPMTGPTGIIFALRSRYTNQSGAEAFYNEANTSFGSVVTGANTFGQKMVGGVPAANGAANGTYNTGSGMSRAQAEALGTDSNTAWPEMSFGIEKVTVTATSRAMKAQFTQELAQDLKAVHGLEAENLLSEILQAELLAEINREMIRTINYTASIGAQTDVTTPGTFDLDVDSNGRWMIEKFKGLLYFLDREANAVAKATRRGKANIIICSSDVASAFAAAGELTYATPGLNGTSLNVDDTGNTFVGTLRGKYKVYIDPYATGGNYMTLGFKGSNPMDSGLFYCPYVPLQLAKAIDPQSMQPIIGFKTRYGLVANPFAEGLNQGLGAINKDSSVYYRKIAIQHLL